MNTYLILIRGINVGGKNKVPMSDLKTCLERRGFSNVSTYIASGNVMLQSDKSAGAVKALIEEALPGCFKLDNGPIKVLVLTQRQLRAVVANKPPGFGDQPEKYRSDVIFMIDLDAAQAMSVFNPREGVDQVWQGDDVIYFQRLDALRAKSRLSAIVGTPAYKSMTIRSWGTTLSLLALMKNVSGEGA